jgi:hypothetical protein
VRRLPVIGITLLALSACGGGGGSLPSTGPTTHPTTTPAAPTDDWTTYAHDVQRTGYETQSTGINASTVSSLQLAWRNTPDPSCATQAVAQALIADEASPLVANGYVYYADVCGYVAALSRDTGSVAWHTQLTVSSLNGPQGTPTLDASHNLLIVPVHGSSGSNCTYNATPCADPAQGGYLAALDAQTGTLVWTTSPLTAGNLRGEPFVLNGVVYEGVSGGDYDSGYVDGGLFAVNEQTGQLLGQFLLMQVAPVGSNCGSYDGGGSWSPISYDGSHLYFGTGNTACNDGLEDSVIQLDPTTSDATPNFTIATFDGQYLAGWGPGPNGGNDEDVGGGEMLWGGNLYFEGKNGRFYGYSQTTGGAAFIDQLLNTSGVPSMGAIWTPTTDGNVVAAESGYNTMTPQFSSEIHLFTLGTNGDRCQIATTNSALYSYAAFVNGVGFTGLDNQVPNGTPDGGANGPAPEFVAFGDNCNILWKAVDSDVLAYFYAGPAIVPSGLYAIDDMGNVYAWKLPQASTAAAKTASLRRESGLIRPGVRSKVRSTLYLRKHKGEVSWR